MRKVNFFEAVYTPLLRQAVVTKLTTPLVKLGTLLTTTMCKRLNELKIELLSKPKIQYDFKLHLKTITVLVFQKVSYLL